MKIKKYRQLDIEKALKGKDLFITDESSSFDADGSKKTNIFDIVNDIRKYKSGKMLDDEDNLKIFNSYMILKFLSAKEDDIILCNYMNKYSAILSKHQMYTALLHLIDIDKAFYKTTAKTIEDSEYLEYISKFYDCSKKESKIYLESFGEDWAKQIKEKYSEESVNI